MNSNTDREKLNLTKEEARRLIYGDLDGFSIISEEITGKSRWSIIYWVVVKRESDGKFFADEFRRGATEGQDERPFDDIDPDFLEVFPVEKKIIVYESNRPD